MEEQCPCSLGGASSHVHDPSQPCFRIPIYCTNASSVQTWRLFSSFPFGFFPLSQLHRSGWTVQMSVAVTLKRFSDFPKYPHGGVRMCPSHLGRVQNYRVYIRKILIPFKRYVSKNRYQFWTRKHRPWQSCIWLLELFVKWISGTHFSSDSWKESNSQHMGVWGWRCNVINTIVGGSESLVMFLSDTFLIREFLNISETSLNTCLFQGVSHCPFSPFTESIAAPRHCPFPAHPWDSVAALSLGALCREGKAVGRCPTSD